MFAKTKFYGCETIWDVESVKVANFPWVKKKSFWLQYIRIVFISTISFKLRKVTACHICLRAFLDYFIFSSCNNFIPFEILRRKYINALRSVTHYFTYLYISNMCKWLIVDNVEKKNNIVKTWSFLNVKSGRYFLKLSFPHILTHKLKSL